MATTSQIRAFSNCDHTIIAWRYEENIPNCIGFAIYKKLNGQADSAAVPIPNRLGFANQSHKPGEQQPSTVWPIQRFVWTDYQVKPGDVLSYRVVPMLINNSKLTADTANATIWSKPVTVGTGTDVEAYFNKGIISSQFMAHQVASLTTNNKPTPIATILADETSPIAQFLGGVLVKHLFSELDAVINDESISIYASLYELNDANVIDRFIKIGKRLNLVLADGAFSSTKPDENADVRTKLKATKINVHDRMVGSPHFAHNKFMVFCKDGKPYKVWTGSTNLTQNGLYTQVNNAIIINNPTVAEWYYNEWNQIKDAGNTYPAPYVAYNTNGNPTESNMTTWFAPVSKEVDLDAARALINNAKQGILFLFFNPGTHDTLYDEIVDNINKPGNNLFVHGVMNQDPGGTKTPLVFIHKGDKQSTDYDTVIPKSIKDNFANWQKELSPKMVTIHSKVVIIDPFGDNPVVMTGSHNLGPKASAKNDDNLNIIEGHPALAQQFAVNILSVYDHFHWRYSISQNNAGAKSYTGLSTDPKWMQSYLQGNNAKQLEFMFPSSAGAPVSTPIAPATTAKPAVRKNAPKPVKAKAVAKKPTAKKVARPAAKKPLKKAALVPVKKAVKKAAPKVAAKKVAGKAVAKKTAKPVTKSKAVKKAPVKKKAAVKKAVKPSAKSKTIAKKR